MATEKTTTVEQSKASAAPDLRLRPTREKHYTLEEIKPGDFDSARQPFLTPEFLRTEDVRKVFGIRRGSLYGLAKLGRVKSCLLRIRGNRLGVRLWSVDSIRSYIASQMQAEEEAGK